MDIKLELVKNSFFNTYILPVLTTMIGAVFGGIITLIVNSHNNKKEVKSDLRIKLWLDIVDSINSINISLLDIGIYIKNFNDGDSWNVLIEKINDQIHSIKGDLNYITIRIKNNLLVALDLVDCNKKINEEINAVSVYLSNMKGEEQLIHLQTHMYSLNKAFNELNMILRSKLFKGLYTNREIDKAFKKSNLIEEEKS